MWFLVHPLTPLRLYKKICWAPISVFLVLYKPATSPCGWKPEWKKRGHSKNNHTYTNTLTYGTATLRCNYAPSHGEGLDWHVLSFVTSRRNYIWQQRKHITVTRDSHAPGRIRTRNPSKRAAQTLSLDRPTTGNCVSWYSYLNFKISFSEIDNNIDVRMCAVSLYQVCKDQLVALLNVRHIINFYVRFSWLQFLVLSCY